MPNSTVETIEEWQRERDETIRVLRCIMARENYQNADRLTPFEYCQREADALLDILVGDDRTSVLEPSTPQVAADLTSDLAKRLAKRLAKHDGCSRFVTADYALLEEVRLTRGNQHERAIDAAEAILALPALAAAITDAKAALVGDSNDAEHDALFSIMYALGYEAPDCECETGPVEGNHAEDCPCKAWEKEGK